MSSPVNTAGLLTSTLGAASAARPKDDPAKIKGAAQQFEALLIGQMMKSMHDSSGGWLGAGDADESSSSAMDYGQEMFAQSMAANGGLGLASVVTSGLQTPPKS
jgi:Rod binding domain-containing protein